MYRKKRGGPRTEPCETPDVTGTFGEHSYHINCLKFSHIFFQISFISEVAVILLVCKKLL